MDTKHPKPSVLWALLTFLLPVFLILYGTVYLCVRPPILPLLAAVALAGLMCLRIGYKWEELQEGMLAAVGRIQIAIAILLMIGMLISAWMASGTIPLIIYWGLKLIAPEHFLLSTFVLCSIASVATGTSFGTMGTVGVALLGVGSALGYSPAMSVGAIVSGAYFGDKMSPVSDSTNIAASVCGVPLFDHILSMFWTTVPAFFVTATAFFFLGTTHGPGNTTELASLTPILNALENTFSLSPFAILPAIVMFVLAYRRLPVLPVLFICLITALAISLFEGATMATLAKQLTSGYTATTESAELNKLLSRGGLMSIMVTVLLLVSGMAFGGILEKARVLEVLLNALLRGAHSAIGLVGATLFAAYVILLGTGSQILAVVVPARAFAKPYQQAKIAARTLSRSCEDAGTLGCPLVPWSVHAFYILGVLGVSAVEFFPYAIFNWVVPVFSLLCAITGIGIYKTQPNAENIVNKEKKNG